MTAGKSQANQTANSHNANRYMPVDDSEATIHAGLSRRVVWSLAAGGSSTVAHLALCLIMGLVVVSLPVRDPPIMIEPPTAERYDTNVTQRLMQEVQPTSHHPHFNPGEGGGPDPGVRDALYQMLNQPQLPTTVTERDMRTKVDVGINRVFMQSGSTLRQAVPLGATGDVLSTVAGYHEAMDRITQEVLNLLDKQKVLLVWAFDQSQSMEDDRLEITTRIEGVYEQLGLSGSAKGDDLLTAVTSYGAGALNHTPQPTADPQQIMAAIRAVPNDSSGLERQCEAAVFAIASFQRIAAAGDRQMALVLVTDESGDMATNLSQLEQTIAVAKAANCRVYVLGREAIFGYPYAFMRYEHEETRTHHWLRIDRGPETPWPEQLQIDGFHARHDAFPSGFGPYEQSRLARETGGVFFLLPSPEVNLVGRRADVVYDGDAMRAYLPSLQAREAYVAERDQSPLRAVVWKVIVDLNPYDKTNGGRIGVRTDSFPIDRDKFAVEAQTQMKRAQDMIIYLQAAQHALEAVAPWKGREVSSRWRANFELIYAQTLAYQARLQEYGWYLAEFTRNPKPIENRHGPSRPTNEWNARTVNRLLKPEITQPLADRAKELLQAVANDHPGTPWAERAKHELARNYGIELFEGYADPRYAGGRGIVLPKP